MTEMKPITGSPKQIEWASTIRSKAIDILRASNRPGTEALVAIAANQTDAGWWIDKRSRMEHQRNIFEQLVQAAGYAKWINTDANHGRLEMTDAGKAWAANIQK